MIFEKNLPDKSKIEGRHGLVLNIQAGSERAAIKIAKTFFEKKYCSSEVESIHNPDENIWVFIWPNEASVSMPAILATANQFPIKQWAADSLINFLKINGDKIYSKQNEKGNEQKSV